MPDRKTRLWVTSHISLSLSNTTQGAVDIGADFISKMARNFIPSDTLSHTWVKGLWSQSAAGDQSAEQLCFGIAFYPANLTAANMPDVLLHDGDYQLHDARSFIEPPTLQTPMIPQQLATIDIESMGQRSAPKGGTAYDLVLTARSGVTPSAGSFELRGSVTQLWLI